MDAQRLAYLDAMGIDVWQPRGAGTESVEEPSEPGITVSAGDGDILCVVASKADTALELARGIGSAMRCPPVWAWPSDSDTESLTPADAVREKMLTQVLVFGKELAGQVLGENAPEVISTARVHVVPGLEELARDKDAKRQLWRLMNENGIAASR